MNYQKFYEYFKSMCGAGLEIDNWHLNGNTEPFDNFFNAAVDFASRPVKTTVKISGTEKELQLILSALVMPNLDKIYKLEELLPKDGKIGYFYGFPVKIEVLPEDRSEELFK